MSEAPVKYDRLVTFNRVAGVVATLSFAALLLISEERSASMYSAAFYVFLASILSLIVLTIFTARCKRRHGVHRHG
ncbi:hypothetical protein [Tsuneonella sp. HG222]